MYAVIYTVGDKRDVKRFRQAPEALDCAVLLVAQHGVDTITVDIKDGAGTPVFAHADIVRTCAQLKLQSYREAHVTH